MFRSFTSPQRFPTSCWPYCSSVVLLYQDQRRASSSISSQSSPSSRTQGCGEMPLHRFSTLWDHHGAYWSPMVLTISFTLIATGRKNRLLSRTVHNDRFFVFKSKKYLIHLGDRLLLFMMLVVLSRYWLKILHLVSKSSLPCQKH